jgi:hypothetical protein
MSTLEKNGRTGLTSQFVSSIEGWHDSSQALRNIQQAMKNVRAETPSR